MFPENDRESKSNDTPDADHDRRVRHSLRLIFASACRITAPIFETEENWETASLTMYARQTLRDAFPDLTQQEIAVLFSAVERFHRSSHNKQPEA